MFMMHDACWLQGSFKSIVLVGVQHLLQMQFERGKLIQLLAVL